jgi:ankyrin repeat protein
MKRVTTLLATTFVVFAGWTVPATISAQQTPAAQDRLWDGAMAGDTAAIAAALGAGAAIDSLDIRRSPNGRRALNWAAWFDKTDAIRFLLQHKAQVNLANLTGFTPLHHAAEHGSLAAARVLLAGGADAKASNAGGETPRAVALRTGHLDVVAVIDSAGGFKD